ncbi:hypothetical protein [Paraburkholderia xenovorans]|uniref:hypothetical protein n=1 Tax=Paraburkholderia xenovorans TaxID=36873 RepID=UPI001F39E0E0|nr:hypothetical protein [Paraburkholderia xenovorans]
MTWLLGRQRGIALDASRRTHADAGLGGGDFLRMTFALVHVETNLLVGNAGSRHELTASSLSFDQPNPKAPPTQRCRWLVVSGGFAAYDSSPPAKAIVNDRPR